ncbi:ABC transporter, substrate-binding protein (cluster 12, methionine/phosphonates) [Olavius sp. associated proteobacterium Delta 1]|nr:ABC transporter, substrate-binding protein (cluster 12, methionine/phosphonates) [Olavius sp. associated proteobacterium Delta 1]
MARLFKNQITGTFISAAMVLLLLSCTGEPDATVVDFSDRIIVARPSDGRQEDAHFKVAVGSIISAQETVVYYHELLEYLAEKLGREIQLVQRKTYREINQLISAGQIDLAFICSGPYASGREKFGFEALAMPRVRGSHLYQSYLIVNKDGPIQTLADLRGRTFAFTDTESNTGKLVPTYWLGLEGERPVDFFDKTIYTYSHDNSIKAVALSLVDGAAVNGQVWEYYQHRDPIFSAKTRVIRKSEPFGNPPVVASSRLPSQMKDRMRDLLYNMHQDPQGEKILEKLMIDRFIEPIEGCYNPILAMKKKNETAGKKLR